MDKSRATITARVVALRAKTWLRLVIPSIAVLILAVAALNLFATNIGHDGVFVGYRAIWNARVAGNAGVVHVADVLAMAAGAIVAWAA